ncbi:MAG: hypothetical protein ACXVKL_17050 [Candidatus Angelobacter sp.]
MISANPAQGSEIQEAVDDLNGLCRIGAIGAFGLIFYCILTIVQFSIVGVGVPPTAEGIFAILHRSRIEGLLRLDLPTVFTMPLYYLLFLGLFAASRRIDRAGAILSIVLAFAGTTLLLATPTGLSMLRLSDQYWAASTDAARTHYLAAGEGVMATDIWHGTGAVIGGVLLQCGGLLMCWVMLRGGVFSKITAWLGLAMFGLDLAHILSAPFLPLVANGFLAIAGLLYPIWFFLVGRRLLQIARRKAASRPTSA